MSWSLAIGCVFIIGVVGYAVHRIRRVRLRHRRRSRYFTDTSSVVWRDISTSSSSITTTPMPDQSSISWHDCPPDLPLLNIEESPFEFNELWELDYLLPNSHNTGSSNSVFLDPDYSADIQELLISVIGTRDFLTQEEFLPGQQVYFCRHCTLAHHEDSWQESRNRCSNCNSDQHTQMYILPNSN